MRSQTIGKVRVWESNSSEVDFVGTQIFKVTASLNLLCLGREEIIERPKVSPPITKSSQVSKSKLGLDLREEQRPPPSVQKTKTKVEQLIESDSESEEDIDLEDAEDDGRAL